MRNEPRVGHRVARLSKLRPRTRTLWRARLRAAIGGCCALSLLLSTCGVTVSPPKRVASATPFPCQGHACGCRTAEQCRRSCCCFTAAQRSTWYRQHNLAVPDDLRSAASAERSDSPRCCSQLVRNSGMPAPVGVMLVQSLRCQGLGSYWLSVGAVLPVTLVDDNPTDLAPRGWIDPPAVLFVTALHSPPDPPPRLVAG
jgi:hypothetical protein